MPHSPAETTLDPVARKTALRMVTYGLYAIGVASGEDRNLFTANWLTQVSFDPPLVALSVENNSHSIGLLRQSGTFAVSILSTQQREQAGTLGKRWHLRPDKIDSVRHRLGVTGCPVLSDSPALFECRVTSHVVTGDSTLFIGEVIHAEVSSDDVPLTMQEAGYRHAG